MGRASPEFLAYICLSIFILPHGLCGLHVSWISHYVNYYGKCVKLGKALQAMSFEALQNLFNQEIFQFFRENGCLLNAHAGDKINSLPRCLVQLVKEGLARNFLTT